MSDVPLLLALLGVALLLWLGPTWRPRSLDGVTRSRPYAIGHRGVVGVLPENELPAFEHALRDLDGIETDVQLTSDGVLVLWHDADLAGRDVANTTYADLAAAHPGLTTLEELFSLARIVDGTILNLELKSKPRWWRTWRFETTFVRAVRASGLADRILVSSFDPFALVRVRLLDPSLRVGVLVAPDLPWVLAQAAHARWLHADAVHPHVSMVTSAFTARFASGTAINVWTVNDADEVERVVAGGATGVIGDDPVTLLEGLHRRPQP